jgi:hypothetical protein
MSISEGRDLVSSALRLKFGSRFARGTLTRVLSPQREGWPRWRPGMVAGDPAGTLRTAGDGAAVRACAA